MSTNPKILFNDDFRAFNAISGHIYPSNISLITVKREAELACLRESARITAAGLAAAEVIIMKVAKAFNNVIKLQI